MHCNIDSLKSKFPKYFNNAKYMQDKEMDTWEEENSPVVDLLTHPIVSEESKAGLDSCNR